MTHHLIGACAALALLMAGPVLAQSPASSSPEAAAPQASKNPQGKMRLSAPRIPPLELNQMTPDQAKELAPFKEGTDFAGTKLKAYNVMATLAQHEAARQKFLVWANHVLGATSTLGAREREILILRIGWLCQSEYEWAQHKVIGRATGLKDDEIARIKLGPDAPGWDPFDAALIRAADELHADAFVSDATWNALAKRYNSQQLIDVVFAVGQYNMVSMVLNTMGVQLDEGVDGF